MIEVNKPLQLLLVFAVLLFAAFSSFQDVRNSGDFRSVNLSEDTKQEVIDQKSSMYERAKPLNNPSGFINRNVSIQDNIGDKVILLDMWTYSCINCQRTLPQIKEWHRKYKDDGLLVIGNHAPEFEFEKKRSNVEEAVKRFNITYPVVMDNEHGTWSAYNNRYWPQKYLIGIDGFIRYEHIGEGAYKETEDKIVELLEERKQRLGIDNPVDEDSVREIDQKDHDTTDIDPRRIGTPEIYFGAWRNNRLANGPQNTIGRFNFSLPENMRRNRLYLDGEWVIGREHATASKGGSILLKYRARNVNMVLNGHQTELAVVQDGERVNYVTVDGERLYRIVQNQNYGSHTLKVSVADGAVEAYTFTFG